MPKQFVYAYTAKPPKLNPEYINVTQYGDVLEITMRSPARGDIMGTTALLHLPLSEAANLAAALSKVTP